MPEAFSPSKMPDQLREGQALRRIGRRIVVYPEVDSTNLVALNASNEPDADGLVVLADFQTAGRGRQGRTWSSPRGASVLCSVLLLIDESSSPEITGLATSNSVSRFGGWLTLVSAVAVCEGIRRATEITPVIKWPNDLRVGQRKLGGILIESRSVDAKIRAWVVGFGVNCLQQKGHFSAELCETATSLELLASHPIDRIAVAREILRSLDGWIVESISQGAGAVHSAWSNYADPIGQRVHLRRRGHEYFGRTIAVDPSGGLIVQMDDGTQEWFDPMLTTLL